MRQEQGVDTGNQVGRVLCIRLATDNDLLIKKEWVSVGKRREREREREREGQKRRSRLPVFCGNEVSRCALEASALRLDLSLLFPPPTRTRYLCR